MTDAASTPGDRVKQEAAAFATAQAERLLVATSRGLGRATAKLTDIAEGRSMGTVKLAMATGKKTAEGKSPLRSVVEAGAAGVKDKVSSGAVGVKEKVASGAVGVKDKVASKVHKPNLSLPRSESKDSAGKGKFLTVIEDIDVGVPVREAYDQWTQFQDFGDFAKGVQGVDQVDDTTTNWRAKVAFAKRSWQAHITEQVPDERIAWTSEGGKGTTKGVVTFHRLGDTLTRVLLVIEYYPKGLMERTGALWRAQGRRARLDLKNFRRFVMLRGEATGEWRGEIERGEVVVGHDEAVADERDERDEHDEREEHGERGAKGRRDSADDEIADEAEAAEEETEREARS
ncbi:SRPBCC family protein [Streptomyces marincola]|uniref:SRPBCC family protein n=1 Tax=Streptomyces marincola TaxID=2878388 RepID=UPI001CF5887E|nr:SRPBCC family protein [Streptomyces marincola]UCM87010.1 SRPBCC family protein [Streptomyces marincola]